MTDDRIDDSMDRQLCDRRKFRLGFILFIIYIIGYTLFTLAGTFFKDVLMMRIGGLNLGVVSGMAIIISAIVIAVLYNWFACKMEES